ncbi:hypothetical protein ACTXT7_009035 [Hymenolepis weldensis]
MRVTNELIACDSADGPDTSQHCALPNRGTIDLVPSFGCTPSPFEMRNQKEISPCMETNKRIPKLLPVMSRRVVPQVKLYTIQIVGNEVTLR